MNIREINGKLSSLQELEKDLIMAEILRNSPKFMINSMVAAEDGKKVIISYNVNGFDYEEDSYLGYSEEISDFVARNNKKIDYIAQLWQDYPEFCEATERLRKYSLFSIRGVNEHLMLTDKLILPSRITFNQNDTFRSGGASFGGGDYEVKRTPERVRKYIANSDKLISILEESLSELKRRKEEIINLQLKNNWD